MSERLKVRVEGLMVDRVWLGPVERESIAVGRDLREVFVHSGGHERSGLELRLARGVEGVANQLQVAVGKIFENDVIFAVVVDDRRIVL